MRTTSELQRPQRTTTVGSFEDPDVNSRRGKERGYYTDDAVDAYVSASDFARLSGERQIACVVRWFHRMYEDPANETRYDSEEGDYDYIWGGPYHAREEIVEEFGDLVSEEVIEAAVSEVERDGTLYWAPTEGNPKHTGGSDEEGRMVKGRSRRH